MPDSIARPPITQTQTQSTLSGPLEYTGLAGQLNEPYSHDGSVKPEWDYLLGSLRGLGADVLHERALKARRILRDDGAAENVYGTTGHAGSSWELDPVPRVIGSEDWGDIEAGLLERAELFNLILQDIYGPRTLLRQGALPPEAVFSHEGFLRACQGMRLPGEHQLILHAADMLRGPDGRMCVLSDRTQVPAGIGYVLENRTVMSRVFPSLYRDSHVHRLASFYQRLRLKLLSVSPSDNEPLIAVLTPGGRYAAYFEHAYLANYLGFSLVQSGDLVVRNGILWMKSLDGLKRVDVILRFVDDLYCDPVELRGDSRLGVPGLLDVARNGRLVIANPPGSGILESPVLLKYLPDISRYLLGREPRLASAATYWCGDEADRDYVTKNIRQLIVKPAFRGSGIMSVWGGDLDAGQLNRLLGDIHRKPNHYVAQERMANSYVPAFSNGVLQPRPTLLRTYSMAADSSYAILPGGLGRVGLSTDSHVVAMQAGGPSKDTWVTASEPERIVDSEIATESSRAGMDSRLISLPSRVVENLYWTGRYAERAEASLRLLRTVFVLINGEDLVGPVARQILLQTVTQITSTLPGFMNATPEQLENPDQELMMIIVDGNRPGSIRSTLNSMLASAEESKELLSTDSMRVINDLRDALEELDAALHEGLISAPEEALDPLVTCLAALAGLMQESMVRGVGWRFMELGRRIERALHTINTIRHLMTPVTGDGDQTTLLKALLISMEVLITYRRLGRQRRGIELGLALVMLDENNPRSVMFQLDRLQQHLTSLPKANLGADELDEEERALLEATTSLKLSRLPQLLEAVNGKREGMDRLLDQLDRLLKEFNRLISDKHFDHRSDPHQLVTTFRGEL